MSGRWKNRQKKVIETSLGKAPAKDAEKGPDVAHLRAPITTSVQSIKQVLALFQTATDEVKDYISYECEILYECRTCRTIFRSLANFILHKRDYCKQKFQFGGGSTEGGFVLDDVKTSDEESRSTTPIEQDERKIHPIIDKLVERQKVKILSKELLNEDLSKQENGDDDVIFVSEKSGIILEKIEGSQAAVFQTPVKNVTDDKKTSMKSEIMEIHGILDNSQAILGTSGVYFPRPSIPKPDLPCSECNITFSTEKTLIHHIRYQHNKTVAVFPCPDCKETFVNTWSVYRHLFKVHRKTATQIKRMRYLVHSSKFRRNQEPEKRKRKLVELEENEENQWMNNIEGDKDFQMCGGCGKRFERKAALQSHSQMCTKRIALCNSIKNTKIQKAKERIEEVRQIKGAAKRKQTPIVQIARPKTPEMTITKENEEVKEGVAEVADIPEMEIFTISDDSNDGEERALKQKRNLWNFDVTAVEITDEFKEYINDDEDLCFLAKSMAYIDKDERKCTSCNITFMSLYMLLRHMSMHFSWYRYQCSKCQFTSFHKYDCTSHALGFHSTPNNLMDSTVLPIPKWKVLCNSHDFIKCDETNRLDMPRLQPIVEKEEVKENSSADTIILEDDEMPDICTENDTVVLSDDDVKDNVGSIDKKKVIKAGPSVANERPIRNRTKSVKTVQNDFIYDLAKALKLNDCSAKNKKVKKGLAKV